MIIEIIESGGIYAYVKGNKFLYIGKTKVSFSTRDNQHKINENPTDFEKLLKQDASIQLKILYDCTYCHLTSEQLDYLETCFIQLLHPKYNIQKINQKITNITEIVQFTNIYSNLTKTETIIYEAIINNFTSNTTFTKNALKKLVISDISDSSWKRTLLKLQQLNIIKLLYTNSSNENVYQLFSTNPDTL